MVKTMMLTAGAGTAVVMTCPPDMTYMAGMAHKKKSLGTIQAPMLCGYASRQKPIGWTGKYGGWGGRGERCAEDQPDYHGGRDIQRLKWSSARIRTQRVTLY